MRRSHSPQAHGWGLGKGGKQDDTGASGFSNDYDVFKQHHESGEGAGLVRGEDILSKVPITSTWSFPEAG